MQPFFKFTVYYSKIQTEEDLRIKKSNLVDNQLTGPIPVSTSTTPGLDQLLKAKHFHFNKNQLSGAPKLFSSNMVFIHVRLFDGNYLFGSIPETLGLVQTFEVLRLDRNSQTGEVPTNLCKR
ncbi:hypothetical protein HN873_060305 [Arachis hypogaea]